MNNRTTLLFADRETIALMRYKSKLVNNMDLSNAVVLTGWGTKNLSDIDYRENDNSIRFYNSEDIFNIGTLIISEPYRYGI
ncbi:hypothetical protein CG709_10305 [Lachnotalea glycerini]|nr:hypothetical protein CG709_10305 [Lachnotalea glycerini]